MPKEILEKIVRAGTYAPSGMGWQSPIILAVTNKELRDELSKWNARIMGTDSDPFYGAPAVLVVLADKSKPTYLYDGSLVMGDLMLAAHALGLGSCWIHRARRSSRALRARSCSGPWASRATMRASATASWGIRWRGAQGPGAEAGAGLLRGVSPGRKMG